MKTAEIWLWSIQYDAWSADLFISLSVTFNRILAKTEMNYVLVNQYTVVDKKIDKLTCIEVICVQSCSYICIATCIVICN